MRVAIVGFGLIGGSLAGAIRARRLGEVIAVDRAEQLAAPGVRALSAAQVAVEDEAALARVLAGAELTVLATPVSVIAALLPRVLGEAQGVTDCGSTKRAVAAVVAGHGRRGRYVPGHPMAGAPAGGLARARPELFEGRRWILCPEGSDADALGRVEALVRGVGAEPVRMAVEEHDRMVAMTSHVPQILSSLLAVLAERRGAMAAAGPAFASATERAGGDAAMWRDIFATNGDQIAAALAEVSEGLAQVAGSLEGPQVRTEAVLELLARARRVAGR